MIIKHSAYQNFGTREIFASRILNRCFTYIGGTRIPVNCWASIEIKNFLPVSVDLAIVQMGLSYKN